MADKRQSTRRSSSSGKQTASRKQPVSRPTSSGKSPVSQKQPPIRRPDMIRCENCGEDYSSTYKRCPFCDERPGRTGIGGRRVADGEGRVHPVQLVGLVISLVLIIAALFIVFTRIAPLFTGGSSSDSSVNTSQSGAGSPDTSAGGSSADTSLPGDTSVPGDASGSGSGSGDQSQGGTVAAVTSITLNKTDMTLQPGETTQLTATLAPAGAAGTVTWSSSDTSLVTVDEYGNVKNVNQGTEKKKAIITATCGDVTATCDVHCKPANASSGSGDTGTGGGSTGGNTSGPVAANTPGTISGAGSGLNVRSEPSSSSEKIASIKNGDRVTILEDTGSGWYKVDIGGGVTGYVSSDYVSVS